MARAPEPPKLRYGGLNPLQRIIIGVFFGLITPLFLIPFGAGLFLEPRGAWEFFYDGLMDWGMLFCIAATLFLLVTPEFWQWLLPLLGRHMSEASRPFFDLLKADGFSEIFEKHLRDKELLMLTVKAILIVFPIFLFGFILFFEWRADEYLPRKRIYYYTNFAVTLAVICVFVIGVYHAFSALIETKNELKARGEKASHSNQDRGNSGSQKKANQDRGHSDDEFDYDPNAFGGGKRADDNRPPPPRGYEKRHPSDVKLWAVVDDPAASEQERKTALEVVLRREAKRKSD